MSFEITERWLMDAGGWQAMKAARAAWQAGAVLSVEFDGTRLRGQVRSAGRTLAAGLLIKSRTDVTNLCSCPQSRRDGALCDHSLSLGLAWVHRGSATPQAAAPPPSAARAVHGRPATDAAPSTKSATPRPSGALIVSLPPTFFDGLRRNRLALSFRAAPAGTPESEADQAIHEWLVSQKLSVVPPQLALSDRDQIESLLVALAGHPAVRINHQPLTVSTEGFRLPLQVVPLRKNHDHLASVKDGITAEAGPAKPDHRHPGARPEDGQPAGVNVQIDPAVLATLRWWPGPSRGFVYFANTQNLFIIKGVHIVSPLIAESGAGQVRPLAAAWLARHGSELSEVFEIDETSPDWPALRLVTAVPRFRLVLDGSLRRLTGRLFCRYENVPEFVLPRGGPQPDPFPVADPLDARVFRERNDAVEAAAAGRLTRAGFKYEHADNMFVLNAESDVLQFYAGDLASLESEWSVEYGERARQIFGGLERITPRFREVAAGTDWLAFDLALMGSAGSTVSAADARRWLQTGQGAKRLPNGKLAVLARESFADLDEVLRDLAPDQEHGHFRVGRAQLGYLESSIGRLGPMLGAGDDPRRHQPPLPLTPGWQGVLRAYQETGARWMLELARQGGGGILADEMGLGKTVQTLAVVSAMTSARGNPEEARRPCLVVAPTSLLGNWREEAARFATELEVLVVRSGERAQELSALADVDLVITSYQLIVRDLAHHRAVRYHAVFLDEAGFIRNPDTQIAKAVRQLNAETRFALTGTPIENSIRDLWSIMDFALPGYLGARNDFRDRYEATVQAGDTAALRRLRRRMAPYWLRRLKSEVAKELPAKIEKIIRCELTPIQRDIYAALQREGVRKVDEARQARTPSQARLTMLTALLRLRQTCGDPRLLGESFPDRHPSEFSGKWAALAELLEEIRDGGHNVLIFSQFTTQLSLLEPALTEAGLDFCRLDGSTRDRESQVAAFRDNPDKRAFLISLKAGGFGLNLTKADTVIHFDPWWNPAVEAQATDRAHRIGQARPVTVYKLIAAGTVEEKIVQLQLRKSHLMESALAEDDTAPLMQSIDDDALHTLLRS